MKQDASTEAVAEAEETHDGHVRRGTFEALSSRDWIEMLPLQLSRLQREFVDDPHMALQRAHDLVAQVVEHQEQCGNDDDAEELAVILSRYRGFCNRLVATSTAP
ncbi:MAG TPA: hypothetical protein VME66_05085 [Candidatus Acidoferrales bacterium]|nr:hypothetical protein [Candidatus Acidoferrales bacterium]